LLLFEIVTFTENLDYLIHQPGRASVIRLATHWIRAVTNDQQVIGSQMTDA